MDFSTPNFSTSDIRPTDFLIFGCRLVNMVVGSRGRVGLVTPTPNLEAHFTYNWGSGFLSVGWGRWSAAPFCAIILVVIVAFVIGGGRIARHVVAETIVASFAAAVNAERKSLSKKTSRCIPCKRCERRGSVVGDRRCISWVSFMTLLS
jgi:hypothetical protein